MEWEEKDSSGEANTGSKGTEVELYLAHAGNSNPGCLDQRMPPVQHFSLMEQKTFLSHV